GPDVGNVTLEAVATFVDANAATGVEVTLADSTLSGSAASNYDIDFTGAPTASADITPKALTASIIGDPTKTYDGDTSATLASGNFSLSGLVDGESFTVTQTVGTYNSANVVSADTVTASLAAGDFTEGADTLASN